MSQAHALLLILLTMMTLQTYAVAQETAAGSAESEAKSSERHGLELLDTIAEGVPNLRSPGNRIHLMSAIADLLWTKDEKRSRAIFEMVKQDIVAVASNLDSADAQSNNTLENLLQRRRECLDRMGRRDPAMALAFLRATRLPMASTNREQETNETSIELYLAGLMVAQDPEQALQLGRAALRKGPSYPVVQLLSQIAAKNKDQGQAFHRELVDRLRIENLSTNVEAANAAWNLLVAFQPPYANEDSYRELVDILAGLILANAATRNPQNYYNQLPTLIPQVEKYAPARVPMLKQLFQRNQPAVDPNARMYQELQERNQNGTVEEVLALATKYGPELQPQIYQQAVWKAMNGGDANRARQIALEHIADPTQRRQMLEQLDNQLLWNAVNQNKVADVRQLLGKVKSVEQRVQVLVNLAGNLANKGDQKQALELLLEARTMLDSSPATTAKLTAQLQLAQAYSSIDAPQAVALIQPIVAQINQLVAAGVILDGIENRYLQEGEWIRNGYTSLANLVNNFEQNLGMLALRDVDGARGLSDQLERPEIRLMAQLEMAQALLGSGNLKFRPLNRQSGRFFKSAH